MLFALLERVSYSLFDISPSRVDESELLSCRDTEEMLLFVVKLVVAGAVPDEESLKMYKKQGADQKRQSRPKRC